MKELKRKAEKENRVGKKMRKTEQVSSSGNSFCFYSGSGWFEFLPGHYPD
jgi:hypothetical protein